jgi:pSer/pThr/pTyr-binding forkhead associated (FHA) protein
MLGYELRTGSAAIRLGQGMLSIGRSIDCHVVFDSAAVSRRHAEIGLKDGEPVVVDLGSANGVFVNGRRVSGEQRLEIGDVIVIGDQQLRLVSIEANDGHETRAARTVEAAGAATLRRPAHEESTNLEDAIELITAVAQRLIDRGESKQASDVLGPRLVSVLDEARSRRGTSPAMVEAASESSLLLARSSLDPAWVDYVVLLHDALGRVMTDSIIEAMHETVRKVPRVQVGLLRDYIARMQDANLSTHDRFLLRRLNGLERVAAGR